MTHQFTDEQIEAVTRELCRARTRAWQVNPPAYVGELVANAARLILEARAERDEWKHKADLELRRCDLFEGYLAATKAERDAALARVRELESSRDVATETAYWDNTLELGKAAGREVLYCRRIAALEAENADMRAQCVAVSNSFTNAKRIAENERLRVAVEELATEATDPVLPKGVQWDDKFLARDFLLAAGIPWPIRAAMGVRR